jgi:AraC-like DNA-binding protein
MTGAPNLMLETPKALFDDILGRVRLASAVFLRGEFTAPWAFTSTDAATLAQVVAPTAKRLVLLHLAVEGSFRIDIETGESAVVQPGEAVVLPYCDVHAMGHPDLLAPVPIGELLPMPPWTDGPVVARIDGGGAPTRVLCGYLHCDDFLFDPILRALPRLIHVRPRSGPAAQWREASLRYIVEEARGDLLARVPELVLVDCLRQYVEDLPAGQTTWLASLSDPVVGRALRMIHGDPAADWTVERLARKLAVSRSTLADRFTQAIGQAPMKYLARWRAQVAADLLRSTDLGLAAIGERVGYDSEAAFSRAFKRELGSPPAAWRAR